MVECSVGSCLSVDPRFACRLVGGSGGNLLLRVRCSDCRKRVAVSRQLESLECGAPLFAVGFLFGGFGLGKGAGFEKLGQVFVSFAFGVAGHWLRCSWCCLGGNCYTLPSCEPFQFSDYTLSAKNIGCHCVTVSHGIIWKRICLSVRTDNLFTRMARNPYI